MKVVKNESETLWIVKIEDNMFTYETPLGMTFNEFNRLSRMDKDLFTYEVGIPGVSYSPHDEQQCDDLGKYDDLDVYEPRVCYDENERIYVEAVIFVNKRLVRLMDVTIEQWKLWMTHEINADMEYDPSNVDFAKWIGLRFSNHLTMDWYTKNSLWMYWIRGDAKEVLTDMELSNLEETHMNKDEVAEIFRIETNIFDFETPIHVEKSNEEEIKDEREPMDDYDIGNSDDHLVSSNVSDYDNEEEEQYKERGCELLRNPHEIPSTCKFERFEVIKYSFGPAKEFVAIKECGSQYGVSWFTDAAYRLPDLLNENEFVGMLIFWNFMCVVVMLVFNVIFIQQGLCIFQVGEEN
ncbi:hypothetical protein Tco_0397984 [Tanacetum coccineum]